MKLQLMLASALVLALFSCKKDDPITPIPDNLSADYVFPKEVGSTWLYETFTIDSLGNETSTGIIDTVQITGQTEINGNIYAVYDGTRFGAPFQNFWRDSSGYVVNNNGEIIYSYSNFTDVFKTGELSFLEYYVKMKDNSSSSITVPAGTFNTVDRLMIYSRSDGTPVDNCGLMTYELHSKYDKTIGLIYNQCPSVGEIVECKDRVQKLIAYSIP